MITRLDHVVIAVPDVATAIEAYSKLGFDVAAGGKHPSIGTANAIIRFGLDYIELLAVEDLDVARSGGPFAEEFLEYCERASGLVGFVFASDGLEAESAGLNAIELDHNGPFAMDRERPDGRVLAWRLVIPGTSPWRKPWPFLIQWETPDAERVAWDAPGQHANRASGVAAIDLLVDDLVAARSLYEQGLGLTPERVSDVEVRYTVGDFSLTVRTPVTADEKASLAAEGPGPYQLTLRSTDANAAAIDPDDALGARIAWTA